MRRLMLLLTLTWVGGGAVSSAVEAPSPVSDPKGAQASAETVAPIAAESLKSLRDPFRRPPKRGANSLAKDEIETTAVSEFSMIGVIQGMHKPRAILKSAKTGKTFFVAEGAKIGPLGGYVRKIFDDRVIINESVVDMLGEKSVVTTDLKLVAVKVAKGSIKDAAAGPSGTPNPTASSAAPAAALGGIPGFPQLTPQMIQQAQQILNSSGGAQ